MLTQTQFLIEVKNMSGGNAVTDTSTGCPYKRAYGWTSGERKLARFARAAAGRFVISYDREKETAA